MGEDSLSDLLGHHGKLSQSLGAGVVVLTEDRAPRLCAVVVLHWDCHGGRADDRAEPRLDVHHQRRRVHVASSVLKDVFEVMANGVSEWVLRDNVVLDNLSVIWRRGRRPTEGRWATPSEPLYWCGATSRFTSVSMLNAKQGDNSLFKVLCMTWSKTDCDLLPCKFNTLPTALCGPVIANWIGTEVRNETYYNMRSYTSYLNDQYRICFVIMQHKTCDLHITLTMYVENLLVYHCTCASSKKLALSAFREIIIQDL